MAGNPVSQYIVEVLFQTTGINKALADSKKIEQTVQKYYALSKSGKINLHATTPENVQMKREFLEAAGMTAYRPYYNKGTGKMGWQTAYNPATKAGGQFISQENIDPNYLVYLNTATKYTDKYDSALSHLARRKEKDIARTKAQSTAIFRLAKRSLLIVPIWTIMRSAYMAIFDAIGDVTKTYVDLENEMGRVATVTRSTTKDNTKDVNDLRKAVLEYSATASRGFKEAASTIYGLGSAGLKVRDQLAGMSHVMNLSIGTFSNSEQVAKLVAGSYNVFGKSIKGAYTASAKMQKISDVLAFTYSNEQVELSQISDAMTYVASAASLMDVNFTTLITTIGVLNTGMLRGSKAGTSLLNAFAQLAQKGKGLSKIGIYFDPSKPLDFYKIIEQLHGIFGETALSATSLRIIMEAFGRRGGRAVAQLISRFDDWKKAINDTKSDFKDFALYMRVQAEDTLPKVFNKLWNSIKAGSLMHSQGVMDWFKKQTQFTNIYFHELPKLERSKASKGLIEATKEYEKSIGNLNKPTGVLSKQDLMNYYKLLQAFQEENVVRKDIEDALNKTAGIPSTMKIKGTGDILNDIIAKNRKITDSKARQTDLDKQLTGFVKDRLKELWKDKKEREKIVKAAQKDKDFVKHMVEGYEKTLISENKIKKVVDGVDIVYKKELDDLNKANKIELMRAGGAKSYSIHLQTINNLLENINRGIDVVNKEDNERIQHLQPSEIYNTNRILEIETKVSDQKKNLNDLVKEGNKLLADEITEITKYSDQLKTSFSSSFEDLFAGKIGLGGMFKNVSTKYRDIISKAFSEGLTDQLFNTTGLDKMFGSTAYGFRHILEGNNGKIKTAFDYGARKTYSAIVSGFNVGLGKKNPLAGFTNYGGYTIGGGYTGGYTGFTLPGFGAGGFFNRYTPGYASRLQKAGFPTEARYAKGTTYGQLLGLAGNTAMSTYGGLQTGMASGILGGLGSAALGGAALAGSAGTFLGMGAAFLGPLGIALSIGSLIAGMLSSPPKYRREEEKTATKEITSRIDISNKELGWVNRNLVALRKEMTYIMPNSYYFSFSENDRFAISASRGEA